MSWDVWLEIDTGSGNYMTEGDLNYTSNAGVMFAKAGLSHFGGTLNRMEAPRAVIILKDVITAMEEDPATYRALEPPNGWGDYDSALEFITKVYRLCLAHPKATLRVSY